MVVDASDVATVDATSQKQKKGKKTISRDKVSKAIAMVQARSNASQSNHKKNDGPKNQKLKKSKAKSSTLNVSTSPEDTATSSSKGEKEQYNHHSPIRSPLTKVQSSPSPSPSAKKDQLKSIFHFTSFSSGGGGTTSSNPSCSEYAYATNQENEPTPRARPSNSKPATRVGPPASDEPAHSKGTEGIVSKKANANINDSSNDSAYKSTHDIEKDIEATSMTLAKISEFIDTVAAPDPPPSPPAQNRQREKTRPNTASYDPKSDKDHGDGSSFRRDAEEESREPQDTVEHSDRWCSLISEDSKKNNSHTREGPRLINKDEVEESYNADDGDGETVATYASNNFSKASALDDKPMKAKSGFDALFDIAMQEASFEKSSGYHVAYQSKKEVKSKARVGSSVPDEQTSRPSETRTENKTKSGKSQDPPNTKDESSGAVEQTRLPSEARTAKKTKSSNSHDPPNNTNDSHQRRNQDPPDSTMLPHLMGSQDELQEKKDNNHYSGKVPGWSAPASPSVLAKISAFIDHVEGKQPHGSSGANFDTDSFFEALERSSLDRTFDSAILNDSVAPMKSKRTFSAKDIKKALNTVSHKHKHKHRKEDKKSSLTETVPKETENPNSSMGILADMEKLVNEIAGQRAEHARAESAGGDVGSEVEAPRMSSSKKNDPICQVRGDFDVVNVNEEEDSPVQGRAVRKLEDPPAETSSNENFVRVRTDPPADRACSSEESSKICHAEDDDDGDEAPVVPLPSQKNAKHRGGPPRPEREDEKKKPAVATSNDSVGTDKSGTNSIPINVEVDAAGAVEVNTTCAEADDHEPFVVDLTEVSSEEIMIQGYRNRMAGNRDPERLDKANNAGHLLDDTKGSVTDERPAREDGQPNNLFHCVPDEDSANNNGGVVDECKQPSTVEGQLDGINLAGDSDEPNNATVRSPSTKSAENRANFVDEFAEPNTVNHSLRFGEITDAPEEQDNARGAKQEQTFDKETKASTTLVSTNNKQDEEEKQDYAKHSASNVFEYGVAYSHIEESDKNGEVGLEKKPTSVDPPTALLVTDNEQNDDEKQKHAKDSASECCEYPKVSHDKEQSDNENVGVMDPISNNDSLEVIADSKEEDCGHHIGKKHAMNDCDADKPSATDSKTRPPKDASIPKKATPPQSEDDGLFDRVLSAGNGAVQEERGGSVHSSEVSGQKEETQGQPVRTEASSASVGNETVSEEGDYRPLQSLLFARDDQNPEIEHERKRVDLSRVQLTLEKIKKFAENHFNEDGGLSKEKIELLEQLDRTFSAPSQMTDLAEADTSLPSLAQLDPTSSVSEASSAPFSKNLVMEFIDKHNQLQSENFADRNSNDADLLVWSQKLLGELATSLEPTYLFQSTTELARTGESGVAQTKSLISMPANKAMLGDEQGKKQQELIRTTSLSSTNTSNKKRKYLAEGKTIVEQQECDTAPDWFPMGGFLSCKTDHSTSEVQTIKGKTTCPVVQNSSVVKEIAYPNLLDSTTQNVVSHGEIEYNYSDASNPSREAIKSHVGVSGTREKDIPSNSNSDPLYDFVVGQSSRPGQSSQPGNQHALAKYPEVSVTTYPCEEEHGETEGEMNVELRQDSQGFVVVVDSSTENSDAYDEHREEEEAIMLAISSSSSEEVDAVHVVEEKRSTDSSLFKAPVTNELFDQHENGDPIGDNGIQNQFNSSSADNTALSGEPVDEGMLRALDFAELFLGQDSESADNEAILLEQDQDVDSPTKQGKVESSINWQELPVEIDCDEQQFCDTSSKTVDSDHHQESSSSPSIVEPKEEISEPVPDTKALMQSRALFIEVADLEEEEADAASEDPVDLAELEKEWINHLDSAKGNPIFATDIESHSSTQECPIGGLVELAEQTESPQESAVFGTKDETHSSRQNENLSSFSEAPANNATKDEPQPLLEDAPEKQSYSREQECPAHSSRQNENLSSFSEAPANNATKDEPQPLLEDAPEKQSYSREQECPASASAEQESDRVQQPNSTKVASANSSNEEMQPLSKNPMEIVAGQRQDDYIGNDSTEQEEVVKQPYPHKKTPGEASSDVVSTSTTENLTMVQSHKREEDISTVGSAEQEKEWTNPSASVKPPINATVELGTPTPAQNMKEVPAVRRKQEYVISLPMAPQPYVTTTAKSVDQTPRMHQSKHFDFIEEVDESENASAYISRMTNLKKGGHLPKLNTDALGSFVEKGQEDDENAIEVDFDVGFVQKALAPISDEQHTWDEQDDGDNSYACSVEERDRYACADRYACSAEGDEMALGSLSSTHFGAPTTNGEYMSGNETSIEQQNSSRSTFQVTSSKTSSSFADRDDGSFEYSTKRPIAVLSPSMNDSENDHASGRSKEEETEVRKGLSVDELSDHHQELIRHQSNSYESSNDEWLRKRDLATRKTQNPNSWITRTASGISSKLSLAAIETPKAINGVDAARKLSTLALRRRGNRRSQFPGTTAWKLSYKDRCKDHSGYFNVDYFSLVDSSDVSGRQPHQLDFAPWEMRDVRQYFLQDQSISFSKNWFGKLQRTRGNQRNREPVAHPRSMEMPMENKPHPEEWTEEWYKVWKAPIRNNSSLDSCSYSDSGSEGGLDSRSGGSQSNPDDSSSYIEKSASSHSDSVYGSFSDGEARSSDAGCSYNDYESLDEDDTPQCGELINVKPKIGERVSRIHPDYTSELRRSRWRKKYFPRGTFPYNK